MYIREWGIYMTLHNKVYIGHVQTINPDADENNSIVESKVVALRLIGISAVNKLPQYKPLRKYKEYYKIEKVEPINGIISDEKINKVLQMTGKPEVKQLKKVA